MKIIWHSNAPWAPTGYGNQTGLFIWRIKNLGHQVIASAFYGLAGAPLEMDGVKILPGSKDDYGNDILLAHKQHYNVDLVIGLLDMWVLSPDMLRALGCFYGWMPVDHDPVPEPILNSIRAAKGQIVFTRFAEKQLKNAGFKPHYVPHGVDSKKFDIVPQAAARAALHLPEEVFVAGMVLANKGAPSRKAFYEQITAFGRFHKTNPKSLLYIHTDMRGISGEDIGAIIESSGLGRESVVVCPQYQYLTGMLGDEHMARLYSAMDVCLNATRGEGFGIPIIEAQMCGTPVIVGDWTAMPELCLTGWKVEASSRMWTAMNSWQFNPAIESIEQSLNMALLAKANHDRAATREKVLEYDADNVTEKYWKPVLEGIEKEIKGEQAELRPIVIPARTSSIVWPKPLKCPECGELIEWEATIKGYSCDNCQSKFDENGKHIHIRPQSLPPKISVVMPVFNGKDTIDRAIESVVGQGADYELIIVDDASDDGTWKHLRTWRDKLDGRINTIKNEPGGGPVGAFNAAIPHIRGEYVIKLDADDWFEAGALDAMADILDQHEEIGFVYGQCQYHGQSQMKHVPKLFNPEEFLARNEATGEVMYRATAHTVYKLVNRGFWEQDGRWFGPHDWDFILQMIFTAGWKGQPLQDVLTHHYTLHDKGAHNGTKARNAEIRAKFQELWPAATVKVI